MKLKKAVITKAFTRWGRAYVIGETVEDRVDKIGVLVHERKARLLKPEEAAPVASRQPDSTPKSEPKAPAPAPVVAIPEPTPSAAQPSPETQAAEPVTVADVLPIEEYQEAEPADPVTGTRRTRKGKTKPE